MDRMILGHGRRHEPSRRINHVRGIILSAAISRGPTLRVGKLSSFLANGLERRVRKAAGRRHGWPHYSNRETDNPCSRTQVHCAPALVSISRQVLVVRRE
jgi:hypothetical protein